MASKDFAIVTAVLAGAFLLFSMKKSQATEEAPSDEFAAGAAEIARLPVELRTRSLQVFSKLGVDATGHPHGASSQADIDAVSTLADELDSKGYPLLARDSRRIAAEAQKQLVY